MTPTPLDKLSPSIPLQALHTVEVLFFTGYCSTRWSFGDEAREIKGWWYRLAVVQHKGEKASLRQLQVKTPSNCVGGLHHIHKNVNTTLYQWDTNRTPTDWQRFTNRMPTFYQRWTTFKWQDFFPLLKHTVKKKKLHQRSKKCGPSNAGRATKWNAFTSKSGEWKHYVCWGGERFSQ